MLRAKSHLKDSKQLLLEAIDEKGKKGCTGKFSFQFSLLKDDVYINQIEHSVNYGWNPPVCDLSAFLFPTLHKPTQEVVFDKKKTNDELNFKGVIYTQITKTQDYLGTGTDNFSQLKKQATYGRKFHLIDSDGNHYRNQGEGIWYIAKIDTNSSNFITKLNALKIEFSITIRQYK